MTLVFEFEFKILHTTILTHFQKISCHNKSFHLRKLMSRPLLAVKLLHELSRFVLI